MGEGREKESREKKRIGGCGGVKDQRIIIFLYIMPFSTPMDTKGKKLRRFVLLPKIKIRTIF